MLSCLQSMGPYKVWWPYIALHHFPVMLRHTGIVPTPGLERGLHGLLGLCPKAYHPNISTRGSCCFSDSTLEDRHVSLLNSDPPNQSVSSLCLSLDLQFLTTLLTLIPATHDTGSLFASSLILLLPLWKTSCSYAHGFSKSFEGLVLG